MNISEEKQTVRDAMNRSLSGLRENPFLAKAVLAKAGKEPLIAKKKISFGLVLAMVAVLVAITALAASLVFSPKYDAKRLAEQALEDQYGITDQMMTIFVCQHGEDEPDGSQVLIYRAVEDLYARQIGVYTVTVKNGKAHAVWSHDGEATTGGIQANAWGAEQIAMLCSDQYGDVMAALSGGTANPSATSDTAPTIQWDAQDVEEAASAEADMQEQQKSWEERKRQVEAAAKISLSDARDLAVLAVRSEYGLNDAQCGQLTFTDDSDGATYRFVDSQPVVDLFLRLTQREDGEYTEKDGIYVVTINLTDGIVDDVLYDSGLASNG